MNKTTRFWDLNGVYICEQLSVLDNGNFREFFVERGEFYTFETGIPGGPGGYAIARIYYGRKFDTVDQLKQGSGVVLEWRALPRRFIDDHSIGQWNRHLQWIVDQNGGHTEHTFH